MYFAHTELLVSTFFLSFAATIVRFNGFSLVYLLFLLLDPLLPSPAAPTLQGELCFSVNYSTCML